MSRMIAFPLPSPAAIPRLINGGDIAVAEAASAFFTFALPALSAAAGPLEERLSTLSHEAVDIVYAGVDAVIGTGSASMEECLLYELIHDEVARRCLVRGIPAPWEFDEDGGCDTDGAA